MKLSLLELTQNILSSLDSDEINSINDTTEARQVSQIIRTTYYNIIARADLPEHRKIFSLTASGDDTQPALMYKPDNVRRIDWIKYNNLDVTEDNYDYVTILPVQQFLDMTHSLSEDDTDVDTLVVDNFTFYFKNNGQPKYCTIIKDYYIIFDSYDSSLDTTLQESKTLCYGLIIPSFSLTDAYIPEIDEQQFPLLLNEAKAIAFSELKQINNDKAELESRRQWRTLQRTKHLADESDFNKLPNFGKR